MIKLQQTKFNVTVKSADASTIDKDYLDMVTRESINQFASSGEVISSLNVAYDYDDSKDVTSINMKGILESNSEDDEMVTSNRVRRLFGRSVKGVMEKLNSIIYNISEIDIEPLNK